MLDFLAHLTLWLVACFVVGAATGAFVRRAPRRKGLARWLIWSGLAFLAGAAAVALGAAQGTLATHIESALACFTAFLLGAGAGAFAIRQSFVAHEAWALGLVPAALLWFGATHWALPAYQAQLETRIGAAAQAAGAGLSGVEVFGRDVVADAKIASDAALLSRIEAVPGVRSVRVAGQTPSAPAGGEKKPEATGTIAAAPSGREAKGTLVNLSERQLDAAACQVALDAVAASDPVVFREARATVNRRVAYALDKAAEVIRRCPETTIEVRGHGEDALSERRARAAERYLRREGVAGRRLEPVGCCARPTREQRASAIDFIVR